MQPIATGSANKSTPCEALGSQPIDLAASTEAALSCRGDARAFRARPIHGVFSFVLTGVVNGFRVTNSLRWTVSRTSPHIG